MNRVMRARKEETEIDIFLCIVNLLYIETSHKKAKENHIIMCTRTKITLCACVYSQTLIHNSIYVQ